MLLDCCWLSERRLVLEAYGSRSDQSSGRFVDAVLERDRVRLNLLRICSSPACSACSRACLLALECQAASALTFTPSPRAFIFRKKKSQYKKRFALRQQHGRRARRRALEEVRVRRRQTEQPQPRDQAADDVAEGLGVDLPIDRGPGRGRC